MYMVQSAWPNANLLGVDMSTFKLAISAAKLDKKADSIRSKVRSCCGIFVFALLQCFRQAVAM